MDNALRDVRAVYDALTNGSDRRALMKVIGVAAEQQLRAWWFKRDADSPNKMGWPRQHFWARIAKRTAFDAAKTTEQSATVVVADPALHAKINGATIRPTSPRKMLAIPMRAEAYGVLPRSGLIPGLFVFRSEHTNGAFLVRQEGGGSGAAGANLTFFYRLVPSTTVPKDPQALPPLEQLGASLGHTATAFLQRRAAQN